MATTASRWPKCMSATVKQQQPRSPYTRLIITHWCASLTCNYTSEPRTCPQRERKSRQRTPSPRVGIDARSAVSRSTKGVRGLTARRRGVHGKALCRRYLTLPLLRGATCVCATPFCAVSNVTSFSDLERLSWRWSIARFEELASVG